MKRMVILLLMVLLILPSCTSTTSPKVPPTVSPDVFYIDGELPDIGLFSGNNSGGRFYEQYTPDFIPSDEYGEIIPFVGEYREFELAEDRGDDWYNKMGYASYGFCTPEGKTVMDADGKNSYISYVLTDDGFEYYNLNKDNEHKEDYSHEMEAAYSYIIPKSGRWVIEYDRSTSWVNGADDGYIYMSVYSRENGGEGRIDVYDYDGNFVKSIDDMNYGSSYSYGLMLTYIETDNGVEAVFVNKDGEIVLGPFIGAHDFNQEGVAVVYDNDFQYLIDTEGNYLTKGYSRIGADFDNVNYIDVCLYNARTERSSEYKDRYDYDIYLPDGTFLKTVEAGSSFSAKFPDNGDILYFYRLNREDESLIWKRLSDGSDFVSKETGQMPNDYSVDDNTYSYIDEDVGGGIVFDGDGETIANLPDMAEFIARSKDGKIVIYRDGYTRKKALEMDREAVYDGTFVYGNSKIYDVENDKVLFETKGTIKASFIGENQRYILFNSYDEADFYAGNYKYYIYDTAEKEMLFSKCKMISVTKIGDKNYINVCTDNTCTLYDEDFNLITKTYNE